MTNSAPQLLDAFAASVDAALAVPTHVPLYRALTETDFAELSRMSARLQRAAQTLGALVAGEVAHRSRPELGSAGLAQRNGHRTAEEMVRVITGSSGREAVSSVRIGRIVHEAQTAGEADPHTGEIPTPVEPWLAAVAQSLAAGSLSVAAADSIKSGLGRPSENVPLSALAQAAQKLCAAAASLDADRLFKYARQLRDEMDAAGTADREAERQDRRSLRLTQLPDGMGRLVWMMDPETLAVVKEVYDRATSPRLGGPRFRTDDQAAAERILADARTVEQLASDDFAQLLAAGAAADTSLLLGNGAPAVRVLVSATALAARSGHGFIEGQHDPISISTVERVACEAGIVPIVFDDNGQPLDVGREQRRFTKRQRIALAARDGGCMHPGCERPPSWCEAHHIRHWHRDGGETNVEDGILLCKHHHLQYHNAGWEVERRRGEYWLIPPPDVDPQRVPILMQTKSGAYRQSGEVGRQAETSRVGTQAGAT